MDRAKFFGLIRTSLFGSLSQNQVAGISAILDEWDRRKMMDLRWLAYMLATALHETAKTMLPIAEYGRGKGHKYGIPVNGKTYYGRGLVQLTWDYNYKAMGIIIGVDLLGNPDLALVPANAAAIMFEGMIRGTFTGKKLADYFTTTASDWTNARRIINGLDRAADIAGYAQKFYAALRASISSAPSVVVLDPPPVAPSPPTNAVKVGATVATVTVTAAAAKAVHASGGSVPAIVVTIIIGLIVAAAIFALIHAKQKTPSA
jgi:putative chitinase